MNFFDDDLWHTSKNLKDLPWQEFKKLRKEFEVDFAYVYEELKEKLQNVKISEEILRDFHLCCEWLPSYSKEANLKCLTRSLDRMKQFVPAFKETVNYCPEFNTWLWSDRDNVVAIVEELYQSLKESLIDEEDNNTGVYHTRDGMCVAR